MSLQPSVRIAVGLFSTIVGFAATPAMAQSISSTTVPTTDVVLPTDGSIPSGNPSVTPSGANRPIPSTGNVPLNAVRFSAQLNNGQYSVMYQPESQPGKAFVWAVPQQMGGGWTPEKRSREIAARLELYRPDGLVEMRTGVENGYNTVCVTTDIVPTCRIVFTVPKGQDPVATRDGVFQNLAIADSGQRTTGVFTLQDQSGDQLLNQIGGALNVNLGGLFGTSKATSAAPARSNGIALKPFLDRADGGTGAQLTSGSTAIAPAVQPVPVVQPGPVVQPAPVVTKPVVKPAKPSKGRRFWHRF
jgi:hypothetical protein